MAELVEGFQRGESLDPDREAGCEVECEPDEVVADPHGGGAAGLCETFGQASEALDGEEEPAADGSDGG